MAVASAGPYASLHLAPDRQPHQHPTTLFFTGRMPFLPPNQQRQSTEGSTVNDVAKITEQEITLQISKNSHDLYNYGTVECQRYPQVHARLSPKRQT